ncbi:MAG: hypothetical protein GC159_07795 [Phycisphaera sp.]|nr:hypothetical protein [Phycisphaera sp.]
MKVLSTQEAKIRNKTIGFDLNQQFEAALQRHTEKRLVPLRRDQARAIFNAGARSSLEAGAGRLESLAQAIEQYVTQHEEIGSDSAAAMLERAACYQRAAMLVANPQMPLAEMPI